MSLAILAKKANTGKRISSGSGFRTGPNVSSESIYTRFRFSCCHPIWKPVQNQSQGEYQHKSKTKQLECRIVQTTDSDGCGCGERTYNGTNIHSGTYYKDMGTLSSSDYTSVFVSGKTCYSTEQTPIGHSCKHI